MSPEMEILERVNSFYTSAFSNLVIYTMAIFAFVGVLVPVVAGVLQSRSIKSEKEGLDLLIRSEISSSETKLKNALDEKLEEATNRKAVDLITQLQGRISELESRLLRNEAVVSHSNALVSMQTGNVGAALEQASYAVCAYLKASDEMNINRVLSLMCASILPHCNSATFSDEVLHKSLEAAVVALEAGNTNGRYSDWLRSVKAQTHSAKQRAPIGVV